MSSNKLVAVATQNATSTVVLYDIETEEWIDLQLSIIQVERKGLKRLSATEFVIVGATMDVPTAAYVVTITGWPTKANKRLIQSSASSITLNTSGHINSKEHYISAVGRSDQHCHVSCDLLPSKKLCLHCTAEYPASGYRLASWRTLITCKSCIHF